MQMKNKKKTQNMQMQRSNKKTYQEQLEDHEEHYECMNFFEKCKMNMQLTPNFQLDSRLKHEIFLIFMIL